MAGSFPIHVNMPERKQHPFKSMAAMID